MAWTQVSCLPVVLLQSTSNGPSSTLVPVSGLQVSLDVQWIKKWNKDLTMGVKELLLVIM
jgi:hypothetical protein